uniref:Ig-like domain-containing protein n=1 Tax=Amphilophus citrinellus TaxID=61819 RepID=A0A3Q0S2H5_AMPCI
MECEQLTQPASVTVQPGQSLTITCQVSYSMSTWRTHWVREPVGKGLEWIGSAHGGHSTYYKDSLKNTFTISLDTSRNRVTLNGQNVQPEDTAVYYCARQSHIQHVFPTGVKCEQLTQPGSETVQPGHNLTITCQVSYSVGNWYTAWIRQPAGKELEWIGMQFTGGFLYKDLKFPIDLDTSSNTVTLNGQSMQPEDTAVYYCARSHSNTKHE